MPTGKQNEFWCFRRNTNTAVDVDRGGGELGGDRGERNRGDESRWKGRKHEAGMTSLGLTFHSRPTPALCILTSLRCVSYILYPTPPVSSCCLAYGLFLSAPLLHVPLLGSTRLLREWKGRKDGETRKSGVRKTEQPPISWTEGMLDTT